MHGESHIKKKNVKCFIHDRTRRQKHLILLKTKVKYIIHTEFKKKKSNRTSNKVHSLGSQMHLLFILSYMFRPFRSYSGVPL